MYLWDTESDAVVRFLAREASLATTKLHGQLLGDLRDFDISPDGERLATVHRDSNPMSDRAQEPRPPVVAALHWPPYSPT
jgi:hypothetical protein